MRRRLALASCLSLLASEAVARDRPNILLVVADDLGHADVGFNGRAPGGGDAALRTTS